jgi:hypothetical protein
LGQLQPFLVVLGAFLLESENDAVSAQQFVGPTAAFHSCITTGVRGPTCIFRANLTRLANLTSLSRKHAGTSIEIEEGGIRMGSASPRR